MLRLLLRLSPLIFIIAKVDAQKYGSNDPIVVPTSGNMAQFPALITSDNFPLFPFTDQFNTGIEINPANKYSIAGDMNIPIPGWGNFDVDGNLYFGNINTDVKVGYQIRPTNHLNIKPETLALLGQNPAFREARRKAKEYVVGRVPYGYEPIKCKPPYCNPFVHHTAVGVEVEEGDDTFFIGGIDFPLPVGPNGAGVRFPLSGAVEQGTSPNAYAHGHAFNPVSPPGFNVNEITDDQPFNRDLPERRRSPSSSDDLSSGPVGPPRSRFGKPKPAGNLPPGFDRDSFYAKFFDRMPKD